MSTYSSEHVMSILGELMLTSTSEVRLFLTASTPPTHPLELVIRLSWQFTL